MITTSGAPSIDTLQKLCDVLDTEPWEFYYFNEVSEEKMVSEINFAIKNDARLLKIVYSFLKSI